jgi:hypothetical protein
MNQKSYFTWTEDKKYTLAKLALRHEGYKLTDRNHQEKWETIIEKLKMKPEFAELEIQPMIPYTSLRFSARFLLVFCLKGAISI